MAYKYMYNVLESLIWKFCFLKKLVALFDVYDVLEFENLTMDCFMCNVSVNSLLEM